MKSELLQEIRKVDKKLSSEIDGLGKETKEGFEKLTKRVDKIGLQVARLEDNAPTVEEFDELERRVTKLENQVKN
jgi:polyhydroxyalkanoate synthesis regulator phasin